MQHVGMRGVGPKIGVPSHLDFYHAAKVLLTSQILDFNVEGIQVVVRASVTMQS